MDAQVAYGFHNLRNEKPYLAHGPIANKVITVKPLELLKMFYRLRSVCDCFLNVMVTSEEAIYL